MYLLLSPAKNLNEKKTPPVTTHTLPELLEQSAAIAHTLKSLDVIDIQELMSVSTKIAELNVARNYAWQLPFDDTAKPAIYLFDGDAYKGLNAYELTDTEIDYLNTHLGILSGLYGIVRPLDLILPYRLEMGTKLMVNGHSDLYAFWGNRITEVINQQLKHINANTLINLASNEYFGAVNTNKINASIITPRFEDCNKKGEYKVISFYAKRARGLMTRFCAVNRIQKAEDLKSFDMEGYYYCHAKSDERTWVFLRDEPI